nr:6-phosphogluconolactonase [Aquibium carbonis]
MDRTDFSTPQDLAHSLADAVANALREAMRERGGATLAVSGGTTPVRFFEALSAQDLDWSKVSVTLVDERYVPPSSDRSNERLARMHLLRGPAETAHLIPLYSEADSVEVAAQRADLRMLEILFPIDVVVLGMGHDGHTASFFPDAENLEELLDPLTRQAVFAVHAVSAGEPRLTLALARIASARMLVLHIEGSEKRDVLNAALAAPEARLPIRRVLDAAETTPIIYWAPSQEA